MDGSIGTDANGDKALSVLEAWMTYGVASPRDTRIHGFEEGGIMARLVMLHCIQPGGLKGLVIKPSRPAEPFVSGSPSLLTRKMPPPSNAKALGQFFESLYCLKVKRGDFRQFVRVRQIPR